MPDKKLILISVLAILIIGSLIYIFFKTEKETTSPVISVDEGADFEQWRSEAQLSEIKKLEGEAGPSLTEAQAEKQLEELKNLSQKSNQTLSQEQAEKQLEELLKLQQGQ